MTGKPTPKSYLLSIKPYAQGKSKVAGGDKKRLIKLSSNENPFGPSPKALKAYQCFSDLHRYPEGNATDLRTAIATAHKVDAERIVCGAGSDELINLLIHAYAGVGDEVLYSQYGFLMYKIYAMAHGATPVTAKETNLTTDVDALLAAVTPKTKIVFLANPNNPTGTYISAAEVKRLRDGLPSHIVLAIDAAYAEYVLAEDYTCGSELVERTENTIMLRTFSKIYGLPALRLGWAYGSAAIIDTLNRIRSPFNVSSAAMVAGVAAVHDATYVKSCVESNATERAKLMQKLMPLGLTITPSEGNFLLIHFPATARKTAKDANIYLMAQGIIPREMEGYGLPGALRITIGTPEDNRAVISALEAFFA